MRITNNTLQRDSTASIERTSEQLLEWQKQVASGKRISKPSDDPTATAATITERSEMAAIDQYKRTADSVSSRLTVVDTALSDIVNRLTEAQSATVSGRGTEKTPQQREAAAQAVEGAKQALLEDMNTSFQGAYVFGGASSANPPYAAGAGGVVSAYQGSTRQVAVDVDHGRTATIGLDGSAVTKGGATTDIFADLDALAAAIRSGNESGIATGMAALQAGFDRVTSVQTGVGTQMAAIESQKSQLTDRRLASQTRVKNYEDADMAQAITGMTQAETAYNAALAATSRISRKSLMDYLS